MTKSADNAIREFRNSKSMELFGKTEDLLVYSEKMKLEQYLHDLVHPEWKPVIIDHIDTGAIISNTGMVLGVSGKILNPYIINSGYQSLKLNLKNGGRVTFLIHRAVADAFIPNPDDKPQVNHINGKKTCNWVGNLEWVTKNENMQHAAANELLRPSVGETNPFAKHTDEQIENACKLLEANKMSVKEVAAASGVSRETIEAILHRGKWKQISSRYKLPKNPPMYRNTSFSPEQREIIVSNYSPGLSYSEILKLSGIDATSANCQKVKRLIIKAKSSTTIP